MKRIVQKFGGTSMGSVARIQNVAARIKVWRDAGFEVVVVVSAMAGETDRLLGLAADIQQTQDNPTKRLADSRRERDALLATGEQASSALLVMALEAMAVSAKSFTGWQAGIMTNNTYTKARIESIDPSTMEDALQRGKVVVVAGFQGVDEWNNITTLGRGGSDTSAVALAAALKADECQIYTDVDGVYTTDPRIVKTARAIKHVNYEEMLEMAGLGAKVLQIRSVEFAYKYRVPLRVLSSLEPVGDIHNLPGTRIDDEHLDDNSNMEKPLITAVVPARHEARITLEQVPDSPGIATAILAPIAKANIDVDMIVQNTAPNGKTDFTFTVNRDDYEEARALMQSLQPTIGAEKVLGDSTIAKVSVVGVGMRSQAGIASQMFQALSAANINILMISTSEIKISVCIEGALLEQAVHCLHRAFGLDAEKAERDAEDAHDVSDAAEAS